MSMNPEGNVCSPISAVQNTDRFLFFTGLVEPDIQGIKQSFDALAKSVPSTFSQSTDDLHWNLIRSKQLKALRLLVQLLPSPNRQLFIRLMELLERVIRLQLNNRMTSANLGTVFGPVLFPNELAQNNLNSSKVFRVLPKIFQCFFELTKEFPFLVSVLQPSTMH